MGPIAIVNGYCTLAQLKAEKGITDTADDSTLELSIAAASRQIDGVCGWRFWQDSTVVAREFTPDNPRCLYLFDDPDGDGISTTTGLIVKLDQDDDGTYETTLTISTDFVLRPTNAADRVPVWPFTEVVLTGVDQWFSRSSYSRPTVEVTAKWGWPAVPDDVTKACLIQAAQLAKAKDAPFGVAALAGFDGVGMRVWSDLNPLAKALVAPYRKPSVG